MAGKEYQTILGGNEMTNEEKSRNLAVKYAAPKNKNREISVYQACNEMAKWKDQQFEKLLHELMICAQQGYTQCASDEVTINEMKQILKGINYDKQR